MMEMIRVLFAVFAVGILSVSQAAEAQALVAYTVNYPLAYFAKRIGGEHVDVRLPVPADIDPAFWEPGADDINAYQQADLILLNGADYAKWTRNASLPRRKLIDTSAAFRDRYIHIESTPLHQHGPGGEHSHAGTAFTTWLDMQQAIQQVDAIREALEKRMPGKAAIFSKNFEGLRADLESIDQSLKTVIAERQDTPLIASHPVYQYMARRYGLKLESVLWEPDVTPDRAQLQSLARLLESHPARWMVWEGEPLDASVAKLEALGVSSLVFSPAANRPKQGDFLSVMRGNVRQLERAFLD